MTVLLTTHYMEEAEQLCDRVGLLLAYASDGADEEKGGLRDVRRTRRTAGRLG